MPKAKEPTLGHCSLCFEKYTFKMRPKTGRAALGGIEKLKKSDFEETYIDFAVLLSTSQITRCSVCKDCYGKIDDKSVKKAFKNWKVLEEQTINSSAQTATKKKKAINIIKLYEIEFWSKKDEEVIKKRSELFPDVE